MSRDLTSGLADIFVYSNKQDKSKNSIDACKNSSTSGTPFPWTSEKAMFPLNLPCPHLVLYQPSALA